jgi:hypothetical protein
MLAVKEHAVTRPLKVLVPLIREELEQGHAAGLEHYRRAGEMLLEAKEQVQQGEWQGWVKRNFPLSINTANIYMRLATASEKRTRVPFSTLSDFRGAGSHQPQWHEPVREAIKSIPVRNWEVERQERHKENRLRKQMAVQLIDIGYKVLATKLHPDKGGSSEAMARLNRVRTLLTQAVNQLTTERGA